MSSGFITETEIEEKRRLRQEEWDKVRTADEPLEAPEEVHDRRSLFDKLEEQKQKKEMEYEEAHKLKNMIKGLDDDEVDFLDFVDRKKIEIEQNKEREEKEELIEFRKNVEKLKESKHEERIQAEIRPAKSNVPKNSAARSQHQLLKGVVVRRKAEDTQSNSSNKISEIKCANKRPLKSLKDSDSSEGDSPMKRKRDEDHDNEECVAGLTCVGILPGLGSYGESSDSSDSSLSDHGARYDMLGRKRTELLKVKKEVSGGAQ